MSGHNDLINNLNKTTIFCNNLGFGEQGAMLAKMPKSIFVCPDKDKLHKMQAQLNALNRECVVVDDFSKPFTLSKFQSNENRFDIICALNKICFSNPIIISTPEILFSAIPNLENFKNSVITIEVGKNYSLENIEKQLVAIGYKKTESVTSKGEFARRGDILDIFNVAEENPIRLDFFDTEIEEIYSFDFLSFERKEKHKSVNILPFNLNLFSLQEKEDIVNQLNEYKNLETIFFDIISLLENGSEIPLEFFFPFNNKVSTTLLICI